jgi:glycerate 2-kinase
MAPTIANTTELAAAGMTELRTLALRVAEAGLQACDPRSATATAVKLVDGVITIGDYDYALKPDGRVLVVGAGKATLAIAATLERILGDRLSGGAIAIRDGADEITLHRIEVLLADHPLPSERSEAAARRIMGLVGDLGPEDLVIAAFTGGSSALTSLPPAGVTQADKRRLHELLLGSGAPIAEVNTVRKHVSAIKGGRLAARVAPARLVNLAVSDVAGDVLEVMTDPSVQDTSTVAGAIAVLKRRGIWEHVPASVRNHLFSDEARSPRLEADSQSVVLVSGAGACDAMAAEARAAGVNAHVVPTALEGEASFVGSSLAEVGLEVIRVGSPIAAPGVLVGCGGEATVSLGASQGRFGAGGPNQEAAAAAALLLDNAPVSGCFIDTDGSDGGTEVAGAIVDGMSARRARAAGIDLPAAVERHGSGNAMAALGDQIVTGPTHTNVNDLFVIAVGRG